MKTVTPSIKVLSKSDTTLEAWLTSKPNIRYNSDEEANAEMEKLKTNNLPISGFEVYCIEFYTSIYFRDLLFTMPSITPWSQSTRNLEMTSPIYQISCEVGDKYLERDYNQLEDCRRRSEQGEALDLIKLDLPRSTMMKYSLYIDRRSLIKFLKTIEDLDKGLFELYAPIILDGVGISMDSYNASKFGSQYSSLAFTDELLKSIDLHKSSSRVTKVSDAFAMHTVCMQFGIAAQFLRQHRSLRRNYEFNRIKELGYQEALGCGTGTLRDRTAISSMSFMDEFEHVFSKRLCWFAAFDKKPNEKFDSWALILDDYCNSISNEEFINSLPCRGNCEKCDIIDEFKLRMLKEGDSNLKEGMKAADRNTICPIIKEKLGYQKSNEEIFDLRQSTQESDSDTFKKWKSTILGHE